MLSTNFWLTLSVAFAAGQVVAQGKKYTKEASANEYVANRFIVEFEDAAGLRKRQDGGDVSFSTRNVGRRSNLAHRLQKHSSACWWTPELMQLRN